MTNALGKVTQTTYDYALGLPDSVTALNGSVTSATYDGFGRLKTITAPLDSSPTLQVTYYDARIPFQVDLNQRVDNYASIRLSRFYDGAGRQIQTQKVGALVNGVQKNVVTDYQYNNVGRLVKQSMPRSIDYNAAPVFAAQNLTTATTTGYDLLGRTLSVTQPNQNAVTYAYTDLTTTVTDPMQFSTITTADVWGRMTRVDAPTGPYVTYDYDILNHLKTTTRAGQPTEIHYDAAGRKLDMTDPDMGVWQYQYDALGNLTLQTDNRGCALNLEYDPLNRLTHKYSAGESCGQPVEDHYYYDSDDPATPQYDPVQPDQIGSRTYMTDASGSTRWIYDERGRMTNEIKTIDNLQSYITWDYNSGDLVQNVFYHDGEWVKYSYNSDGSLHDVLSLNNWVYYLRDVKRDEAGRITSMDLGYGTVTRKTLTYFDWNEPIQGGLLRTLTAKRPYDNVSLQDFAYTYDKNGNVLTITDNLAGPQTQTFTYDSLNRITSAVVTGGVDGLYSETYGYDSASGNLSLKAGVSYTYDPNHPHAVQSLSNGNAYAYDPNGNMISRNVNGQIFDLTYDAENRLIGVTAQGVQIPPTATPTLPATLTPTITPTFTETLPPTETLTPTETSTPTETGLPTDTATATLAETPTETSTPEDTATPTNTPEVTDTPTETPMITDTPTDTPPATGIPTVTSTNTPEVTFTPSLTPTVTNTPTITPSPTATTPPVPVFANASFVYDGDGRRVKSVITTTLGTTTTYFFNQYFEWATGINGTYRKYYYAEGQRIAMGFWGDSSDYVLLLGDHLGSTSLETNAGGWPISRMGYKAWGEERYGATLVKYTYTGQYSYTGDFGLMYYGARWYDPSLGRFNQPDTIIPQAQGVQAWDRYGYANNNPVRFTDPTGHGVDCGIGDPGCRAGKMDPQIQLFEYNHWLIEQVRDKKMNDLEAFSNLVKRAASLTPNCTECFVNNLGAILTGHNKGHPARDELAAQLGLIEWDPLYKTGRDNQLDQSGFDPIFQDPSIAPGGNPQPHHFWFYVQVGFESGSFVGVTGDALHETVLSHNASGNSMNDLYLGFEGVDLGTALAAGTIDMSEVENYIVQTLSPGSERAEYWRLVDQSSSMPVNVETAP